MPILCRLLTAASVLSKSCRNCLRSPRFPSFTSGSCISNLTMFRNDDLFASEAFGQKLDRMAVIRTGSANPEIVSASGPSRSDCRYWNLFTSLKLVFWESSDRFKRFREGVPPDWINRKLLQLEFRQLCVGLNVY